VKVPHSLLILAASFCTGLLAERPGRAEVQVIWDRNTGGGATGAFQFARVLSPSKTDAATAARFTVIDGSADGNGGDVDVLNDGLLPAGQDQPDANFFFAAGSRGGRLLVDLGQATEIREVNTYSWHGGTRGPQVYVLYGSDGTAKDFAARPGRDVGPEKAGWRRIASVDTRPAGTDLGGQYGVSVRDSADRPLGKYSYLLLDVAATERADPFGQTFWSEIDVRDGRKHAPQPEAAGFEVAIDATEMPQLADWVEKRLRPVCREWYPKIVEMLPSEGFKAPRHCTVTFRKDMQGVAATGGTQVNCAGQWFSHNLDGEAAGAVVHELVHVVQRYGRVRGGRPNPGWLVEGIADYIRWFLFEPESQRPRPDPARAKYTDSYRTTAAFLNYVVEHHDKDFVRKINAAMREGRYFPELWKEYSGKTVDELWAQYVATLKRR
jgi:hypothetical protein